MIQGVILDMDGTLVDSNDAHARAFEQAFRENGFSVEFRKIRPLIGMGGKQLVAKLISAGEDESLPNKIDQRQGEIFKGQFLPHIRAFPKARELVVEFKKHGFRCVVGSSSKLEELNVLMEKVGVTQLLDDVVASSDVEHAKPEPDIVESALEKLQLPPQKVLMLGDTPYDIAAASKAGVKTVALCCGGWSRTELAGALAVYENPEDLLNHLPDSPFFDEGNKGL